MSKENENIPPRNGQPPNLHIEVESNPFLSLPSGLDIAHWFCDASEDEDGKRIEAPCHRFTWGQGVDGFDLWRSEDNRDYCYVWMEAFVDYDYDVFFLLDVRTSIGPETFAETRDHLFVASGAGEGTECEWQNTPIPFSAPVEQHRDRSFDSLRWFCSRIEGWKDAHHGAQIEQRSE